VTFYEKVKKRHTKIVTMVSVVQKVFLRDVIYVQTFTIDEFQEKLHQNFL
jgi:hypothetical protein